MLVLLLVLPVTVVIWLCALALALPEVGLLRSVVVKAPTVAVSRC